MKRLWRACWMIGALSTLAACARDVPTTDGVVPRTVVRDSAGVRVVASGFARDSLDASEYLRTLDTLLDGAAPNGEHVVGLVALQPLADSSIVLFSASGPSLLRFPAGNFTHPDTLRPPGEEGRVFSARTTLLPYRADTLLLWDSDAKTISPVTNAGVGPATTLHYADWQATVLSGALHDGRSIAVTGALPSVADAGVSRAPLTMLRFATDGSAADTLLQMRGPERTVQVGQRGTSGDNAPVRSRSVPFGRTSLWTVGSENVLVLDTEACRVSRHNAQGALTLQVQFLCTLEAVTPTDRQHFLDEVLATARSRSDSTLRERFVAEASFPPTKPTASALLTDPWDRIWVRLPVSRPDEDWTWWVFGADGMPIVRLGLGAQWRIAAVRDRDLIAVQSDRPDAPPVVVRMALPDALHRQP